MIWTEADDNRIADMLVAGKSAREIAEAFGHGVTRNGVIGRVHRNKALKAIGFSPRRIIETKANIEKTQIKASNVFRGERPAHKDNVVTLHVLRTRKKPGSMAPIPVVSVKAPLRVVSNNEALMVADYLQKHGGARRYEMGFCSDYHGIKGYLAFRDVELTTRNGGKFYYTLKHDGQSRKASWDEVLAFVDEFRRAEGLEPILARRA